MVLWVPVLGSNLNDEGEVEEFVHGGNDVAAICDCQRAVLLVVSD